MALNDFEITDEQLKELEIIKVNHDDAYLYITQALYYQEHRQYSLARDMFEKGFEKIDKAVNVRCDRSYCHGPKWDDARKLQQKMRKTTQMLKSQLRDIQNCTDAPSESNGASNALYIPPEFSELPPSYEKACEHGLIVVSKQSLSSDVNSERGARRDSSEVVELFSVQEDVMLFYVASDGSVSTTSTPSSLHIYQFIEHDTTANYVPPAWLQIGSWTYPLIPGQSPVLESGYGAFLFPNVILGQDSSVGVILPPTVDAAERAEFLSILNSLTAFRGEGKSVSLPPAYESSAQESPTESFSEAISRGIVAGAEYLSAGISKHAEASSEQIHKGASKARENIHPNDKPVVVGPCVREASGVALKATGFLVKKLNELTLALSNYIVPRMKEQGSKLLSKVSDNTETNDTMDGVLTVAAGGLQGLSTVYFGLEQAARTLAYSLSQETVNVVGYKYGNDAAKVVENALLSVGNLAVTTQNVQSLGVKAIAKRSAKDAGKAVLADYVKNEDQGSEAKATNNEKKLPEK